MAAPRLFKGPEQEIPKSPKYLPLLTQSTWNRRLTLQLRPRGGGIVEHKV